jgi:Ca2+-binding EF-hand superfamily protein
VEDIVISWFAAGAPLALTKDSFPEFLQAANTAGSTGTDAVAVSLFEMFDTDGNGKVDALEILGAAVVLAQGNVDAKMATLFRIFDFAGTRSFNFDEVEIFLHCVCRGLAKVCDVSVVADDELMESCKQMFDAHNLPYEQVIKTDQIRRWLRSDMEAASFVATYHGSISLPAAEERLAQYEAVQAEFFSGTSGGGERMPVKELLNSEEFIKAFDNRPVDKIRRLVGTMANGKLSVSLHRYVMAARAWNAFILLDEDDTGRIAGKELPDLLHLRDHEAPDAGSVHMHKGLNLIQDGEIKLGEWVAVSCHKID